MRTNVPIAVRTLRRRHRLRQDDLGRQAGVSRDVVSRAELGELDGMTIGLLARLANALDGSLVVEVRWQGAELDRLVDRAHAATQEAVVGRLRASGWIAHVEVSFNHYGDRGRCDVVAWHPGMQVVLVVEVKSRVGDVQATLGALDVKRRLGGILAKQLGWPEPTVVVAALALTEARTTRRVLTRHPSLFGRFALRGRAALSWLRRPSGAAADLLWFEVLPDSFEGRTKGADRVRADRPAG